ncbi:AAA-16 domain-containing protein [Mycena venus]|uniref:AAA-16 domain-containing protein n=1 Tax=Mycena venus TaxID=2733690 RepID=A0A8H6YY18_9AGAR|nr:AAA-16 domain-containing protein [Mycena venus]
MPVISSSSGSKGRTYDGVEELKHHRTPEHMEGQRSDPLESTQITDRNFLDRNGDGSQVEPATVSPNVPPSWWLKLLGRLHRKFGKQSPSTTASASPASAASPPALSNSKTSSFLLPLHSDPQIAVPHPLHRDESTFGDAAVGGSQVHLENRIIEYASAIDLPGSGEGHHSVPGPSNSHVAVKRPAFERESKTSINVNHYIYGGRGGPGGSGMRGRGGDGGIGEGPTMNYHMEAVANVNHIQRQGESGGELLSTKVPPRDTDQDARGSMGVVFKSTSKLPYSLVLRPPLALGNLPLRGPSAKNWRKNAASGLASSFNVVIPPAAMDISCSPTIAYQLCLAAPGFKQVTSQILEDDPSIANHSLSVQLQKLIVKPCRRSFPNPSLVIVIDGLDECEDKNVQAEILRSFSTHQEPLPLLLFHRQ